MEKKIKQIIAEVQGKTGIEIPYSLKNSISIPIIDTMVEKGKDRWFGLIKGKYQLSILYNESYYHDNTFKLFANTIPQDKLLNYLIIKGITEWFIYQEQDKLIHLLSGKPLAKKLLKYLFSHEEPMFFKEMFEYCKDYNELEKYKQNFKEVLNVNIEQLEEIAEDSLKTSFNFKMAKPLTNALEAVRNYITLSIINDRELTTNILIHSDDFLSNLPDHLSYDNGFDNIVNGAKEYFLVVLQDSIQTAEKMKFKEKEMFAELYRLNPPEKKLVTIDIANNIDKVRRGR